MVSEGTLALHVAGRGAVSCLGADLATTIDRCFAAESGIRPLARLAGTDCLTKVCGEIDAPGEPTELAFRFALAAAEQALADATINEHSLLVLASTKADLSGIVTAAGEGLGSPHRLVQRLAEALAWRGPTAAISCACASGLSALAYAGRAMRRGRVTRALVVGTDSISSFVLRGFSALLALAEDRSRPFDRDRDGLNLGEGAGAILLSSFEAEGEGITLAGFGESNDANHVTGPSRDGQGLALAIDRALRDAKLSVADIDYVHLHGTGTPFNDAMECEALARVFDTPPPASGSKSQFGHTLGAAGLLESLVTMAALERGHAPGNVGLEHQDPDAPVALLRDGIELPRSNSALKVAAGFGGINVALAFRRSS